MDGEKTPERVADQDPERLRAVPSFDEGAKLCRHEAAKKVRSAAARILLVRDGAGGREVPGPGRAARHADHDHPGSEAPVSHEPGGRDGRQEQAVSVEDVEDGIAESALIIVAGQRDEDLPVFIQDLRMDLGPDADGDGFFLGQSGGRRQGEDERQRAKLSEAMSHGCLPLPPKDAAGQPGVARTCGRMKGAAPALAGGVEQRRRPGV
jgi:hypothetical protein